MGLVRPGGCVVMVDMDSQGSATVGLRQRSVRAVGWNYAGGVIKGFAQLAIGVLLARMLPPESFGVVAIAWIFVGLGNLFSDFGLTAALVQKREVTDKDISFSFLLQLLIGLSLTIIFALSAPWIANLYGAPGATPIIAAMGVTFIAKALGQTSVALLQRNLLFRTIQVASIASYLAGYGVVATLMALSGYGPWSLVAAQLVQATLNAAILYLNARHPILYRGTSDFVTSFGVKVVIANLASWVISNVDSMFVGQTLGPQALGLYNRAFTLVNTPMYAATSGLQPVLFSAASRASENGEAVGRAYLVSILAMAAICFPPLLTVAANPQVVVLGMFGEPWRGAIAVIQPLAIAMCINAILSLAGPVLMAKNLVHLEIIAQVAAGLMLLAGLFLFGTELASVGWIIVAGYLARLTILQIVLGRSIRLPSKLIVAGLLRVTAGAAIVACLPMVLGVLGQMIPEIRLALTFALALASYLFLFVVCSRHFTPEPLRALIRSHSPAPIARWFA